MQLILAHLEERVGPQVVHQFWEFKVFLLLFNLLAESCSSVSVIVWTSSQIQPPSPIVLISYSVKLPSLCEQPLASCAWLALLHPWFSALRPFSIDCSTPFALNHNMSGWGWWVYLKVPTISSTDSQHHRHSLKWLQEIYVKFQPYLRSLFLFLMSWCLKSWLPREASGVFKQVCLVSWLFLEGLICNKLQDQK